MSTRQSNSSLSMKRKSGAEDDEENRSPNLGKSKDSSSSNQPSSAKKTRYTRSTTSNGSKVPARTSRLPTARTSKIPGQSATSSASSSKRRAVTEKNSSERLHKTPSKVCDRSSLLSPGHGNSSYTPPDAPSSVLKFPKQCLSEKIRGYFERAPIKSEEDINKIIGPKLKPRAKWTDFREKAKRQTEVITDLKTLLKDTLHEYKNIQNNCVDAEKTMEEQYQNIRSTLKDQLKQNAEMKKVEAQLKQTNSKLVEDSDAQKLQIKELKQSLDEYVTKHDELSKNLSEMAKKLEIEVESNERAKQLLDTTKRDLSAAVDEKVAIVKSVKDQNDQKLENISSEYKTEIQALKADLEKKQAELSRFQEEKEQMTSKASEARENILKSQSELREKEISGQRLQTDLDKASAEIEQLKAQISQKDADLRNTLNSMQEFQRQSCEEKASLRAEIGNLQPRIYQLEEQRLAVNSELAAKKEELLSLSRECNQVKENYAQLQATLVQREKEVEEAKSATLQLEVEKEMRIKSELREENERSERIAACAQLVATQTECEYRVREIEASSLNEKKSLEEELCKSERRKESLEEENNSLQDQIAGLEGEITELNRALQHAEQNHEAVTELSKVKGEVEMYKHRVLELEKTKNSEGQSASNRISELEAELAKRDVQRRKLHNLVQELRGNVRVFARVRPYLPSDGDIPSLVSPINTRAESSSLNISRPVKGADDRPESHGFTFDKVFNPSTSQETVFDEVSEFVQSALDGYNVCLFSYGQTGSGKTHTMQGSGDGPMRGIIPRAIQQVGAYKLQLEEKGWEYSMEVSFIEIYNETIRDLLRQSNATELKHDIKKDANGRCYVTDVTMQSIDPNNKEQLDSIMELAARHRSVAQTAMNAQSSRSHSVFALHLKARHENDNVTLKGTLSLVDLAGSERLDRSEVTGSRMKETLAINKSLSSLTDVFTAIANKQAHIPFRNSKLTHLLQPALSGDGKALMMVNLSPTEESYHESLCSLRFASQVNQCELGKPKKQVKEGAPTTAQTPGTSTVATKGSSLKRAASTASTRSSKTIKSQK